MAVANPEKAFERAVRDAVRQVLAIDLHTVPLTYPPSAAQGDLATPVCFELARTARRAPGRIAEDLAAAISLPQGVARIEAAGNGYLNAFFDRPALLREALVEDRHPGPQDSGPKIVVEHTNINPNKAAHIGHLRNAVLGDSLVRTMRRLGERVEVQNYIDDTGVQVADLAVGFEHLRHEDLDAVRAKYPEETRSARHERFDYVAWDLYAAVTRWYEEDDSRLELRAETLRRMEERDNPTAELADHLARRMVRHHLATMHRLGVAYDILPRESDILASRFWDDAFARLREAQAIHLVEDGKHAGCWVMDLPGAEPGAGEDQKIIVRSNGTVTYVGKDIAYQLWKFGLLGRDFRYVRFPWTPDPELYETWSTDAQRDDPTHPPFGHADRVYNVIDTRQSYLQRVVAQGLRALGYDQQADQSIHFQYEMVALSPASVATMFPDYPLSDEDRTKPYLEMSGRRGLGVRADDLVDTLIVRARDEVRKRNPGMPDARIEETAHRIAVGALRYYMLRYTRNRVVAFDLDAALAFEGETGPYLQYSVVRAKNILAKIAETEGSERVSAVWLSEAANLEAIPDADLADHWNLALLLLRTPTVLRQAVDSLELAVIAKHAYVLAQEFNTFYHRYPVAQEPEPAVRDVRIALVRLYHDGMTDLLGVMGIEVPERM